MEIFDFYDSDNKDHWLGEIRKSAWRAGKYLYELLRDQKLKELCGESTKALLLIDGDKLTDLMYENGIGVQTRTVIKIKDIDSEFFEELE